jgi:catechol 2,3-dioxygenase
MSSTMPRDPEEATAATSPVGAELPAATHMGPVHLTVASLDRSLRFYEQSIGLAVRDRSGGHAVLGTARADLLDLTELPGATPADGYAGLYHFALLVPRRVELAGWLAHAARSRVPLTGLSDHFVSEAIYLSDPDNHGIEVYWDRPRELWEGQVFQRLTTMRLDVDSLLGELSEPMTATFEGMPEGTAIGHVHLRVANVPETIWFYRDLLGFGLMAALGDSAAFLGAGGYHHHLGANTWESSGAPRAPEGSATLTQVTILVPGPDALQEVDARLAEAGLPAESRPNGIAIADPSGNPVLLTVAQ